jgi:hypothetical protein
MKELLAPTLALALLGACVSTSYLPTTPGMVGMTVHHNSVVYVKDGKRYPGTILHEGLVDAVEGNPRAQAQARQAHWHGLVGTALALAGGGCESWLLFDGSLRDDGGHFEPAGYAVLGGCALVAATGLYFGIAAQADRIDAINLYNDGVLSGQKPGDAPPESAQVKLPGQK